MAVQIGKELGEDNHCFPCKCGTCTNEFYKEKIEPITMPKQQTDDYEADWECCTHRYGTSSMLLRVQKGRDQYFEKLSVGHEPQIKLLKYRNADKRI